MRKKIKLNKDLLDMSSLVQMLQIVWQCSKSLTLIRLGLQFLLSILPLVPIVTL